MTFRFPLHALFIAWIAWGTVPAGLSAPRNRPQFDPSLVSRDPSEGLFLQQIVMVPAPDPDSTRLFVFVRIAPACLQFVDTDSGYAARFDLTALVLDKAGGTVSSRIVKKSVIAATYPETRAADFSTGGRFEFSLPPGEYSVQSEVYDLETQSPFRRTLAASIPDRRKSNPTISALLFFRGAPAAGPPDAADPPFPAMPPVRSASDSSFMSAAYLYWNLPDTSLMVSYRITREKTAPAVQDSFRLKPAGPLLRIVIPVSGRLDFGLYKLDVRVTGASRKCEASAAFQVQWGGRAPRTAEGGEDWEALAYVMAASEFKRLKALPPEERDGAVAAFWKSRDPAPETGDNGLEREFHGRVQFANRNFSTFKGRMAGWRMDRGRIYIQYGPPERIEKSSPFERTGGVEIWYYRDISKTFIFADRNGMGNYRLVREDNE
jgi:GWxTD domain-containing protein